ncbi:M23 family metallopeptidase [Curtobacterium sp. MCBD17_021]|uniref:M23 family metallopeptidase n=1 Tax=Curtobacterium sp. MCBD17_021 TaxID=2175665 RepID=UPI0015E8A4E5|nr:M23 family metallopeptidase [Curtobacterium sp. MCBD17_021]
MGFDLGAPTGQPIHAVAAGTVTMAQLYSGFGYHVEIDHGEGLVTTYSHMIEGSLLVSNGQRIPLGTQLGLTGQTGNVTGPHLHFEYHVNGAAVDPAPVFENAPLNPGTPTNPAPVNPLPVMEDEDMYVLKNVASGHVFVAGMHYVRHLNTSTDANLIARVVSNTDEIHELNETQTSTTFAALGIPRAYTDPSRLPHGGRGGWWSLQDAMFTQAGGSLAV